MINGVRYRVHLLYLWINSYLVIRCLSIRRRITHQITNLISSLADGTIVASHSGLGSCGASFDKLEKRKDIFFKKLPYTNETYFDYEKYSKSPSSNFFHQ